MNENRQTAPTSPPVHHSGTHTILYYTKKIRVASEYRPTRQTTALPGDPTICQPRTLLYPPNPPSRSPLPPLRVLYITLKAVNHTPLTGGVVVMGWAPVAVSRGLPDRRRIEARRRTVERQPEDTTAALVDRVAHLPNLNVCHLPVDWRTLPIRRRPRRPLLRS